MVFIHSISIRFAFQRREREEVREREMERGVGVEGRRCLIDLLTFIHFMCPHIYNNRIELHTMGSLSHLSFSFFSVSIISFTLFDYFCLSIGLSSLCLSICLFVHLLGSNIFCVCPAVIVCPSVCLYFLLSVYFFSLCPFV